MHLAHPAPTPSASAGIRLRQIIGDLAEPLGWGLAGVGMAFALANIAAAAVMLLFKNILRVGAMASGLAALSHLTTVMVTS